VLANGRAGQLGYHFQFVVDLGATTSFGNNRLFANGAGTAPTPVGGASTDFGQQ
jgi:hypothetical protein